MVKIQEVDDSAMAITRRKYGRGFAYYYENGKKIKNKEVLKRLRKLVIPPMWTNVLICRFDDGHVQAVGRDLKGRKQYIYHSVYGKVRQEEKFKRMLDFVDKLPKIRKKARKDLNSNVWNKKKVLALIIMILDEYGIRIGNKQYRNRNETFGLSTLRRKHLSIEKEELVFTFKGKSNKIREVHIDDDELIPFIKKAADMPGYEIFRYRNDHGTYQDVDSDDVNNYISKYMAPEFSSKDFRTWAGSRLAIEFYPKALTNQKKKSRRKFSNIVIKMVAEELGNTPTVCRNYYVHPAIFDVIDKKNVPHPNPFKDSKNEFGLTSDEKLAQKIIGDSY
ncbi:DNA topoisomerase IB [Aurantibacter sp.]|uniref:DNA topoisomerase IB n=1 Tax=Aurantibacter sp. TaxID=2807103 RepID=UPI00326763B0